LKLLFEKHLIKTYLFTKDLVIIFCKFNYADSVIKDAKIISKPGKKIYVNNYQLESLIFKNKSTFYFLSTPKGLLEGKDALLI